MLLARSEAPDVLSNDEGEALSCTRSSDLRLEAGLESEDEDDDGDEEGEEERELPEVELGLNEEARGREGRDTENEGPVLLPVANQRSFPGMPEIVKLPHPID